MGRKVYSEAFKKAAVAQVAAGHSVRAVGVTRDEVKSSKLVIEFQFLR